MKKKKTVKTPVKTYPKHVIDQAQAIADYENNGMFRITQMIPLLGYSNAPRTLIEWIEEQTLEDFEKALKISTNSYVEDLFDGKDWIMLAEWLTDQFHGKFLVFGETPVVDKDKSFSWGLKYLTTFVADDLTDAIRKGLVWSEKMAKPEKRKPSKSRKK